MGRPDLSVIVVTYKHRDLLAACLESVYATADGLALEVVVVDNASGDGTETLVPARFPEARLLVNSENVGFARATNQGMAQASGEYVLWLNPDTVVQPGALGELIDFLREHPDAGAVGPKMVGPDGALQYSCRAFPSLATGFFTRYSLMRRLWPENPLSRRYLLSDWDHATVRAVDWVSGACLMTSRVVLDRVGGLDEGFFLFNEDVDWCRRLALAGPKVYYNPRAVVVHRIGASRGRVAPRIIIERHRGMFRYYRKHMRTGPWLDLPIAAALTVRAGVELLTRSLWPGREAS